MLRRGPLHHLLVGLPFVNRTRVRRARVQDDQAIKAVLYVPVVMLSELNLQADPMQPSLLSVDCQGGELGVLRDNDWGPSSRGSSASKNPRAP